VLVKRTESHAPIRADVQVFEPEGPFPAAPTPRGPARRRVSQRCAERLARQTLGASRKPGKPKPPGSIRPSPGAWEPRRPWSNRGLHWRALETSRTTSCEQTYALGCN
jgi:hypothetical protein